MMIEYRKADIADAELLISIYNSAFYSDYIKYGECPAYGKTKEMMEKSILNYPKFIILYDSKPVGCVSCQKVEVGIYEVGCLCVIPEYQGKGVNALIFNQFIPEAIKLGFEYAESNPELEMNSKVQSMWDGLDAKQHKRRRAYIKSLK